MNHDMTILLVEDDTGHARLVEKNLRRSGFKNKIKKYNNGRQVIDYLFAEPPPDKSSLLILLDLNMPIMDGFQVLERIKSEATTKQIPVIILTTTDDPREIERCYEMGCNVFITKPVDYKNFAHSIKQLGLFLSVIKVG